MDDIVADIIKEVSFVDTTVDLNETDLTPIQEFYRGSSVFVTGGTGFLGQLLIEKLLRSTPVSKIFVLIRSKKGKTVEARLAELLDGSLFQRLQKQTPAWRDKVVPVAGDCSLPDLNLRDQDKKLLTAEVDIIFHVAATVRFDEKLKMATFINVRATRDMLRLARQIPHLKSFVHVSTLYSNCNKDVVLEKVYPPAVSYETLIQMADGLDDKTLEKITPSLLSQHPNTYVFTKQIAEAVVKEEGLGLPMAIHRPSVVTSTYREPVRAWVDTMYGATGITVGAYLGVLRVLHCDSGNNANLVPADMCVNSMIATAWEVGVDFEKAREGYVKYDVPVYNFESSNDQPIAWSECNHLLVKYIPLTPSNKSMWYICFSFVKFYPLYLVHVLLLHTVPGIIVDGLLLCTGKPPQ
ncbi:hypothetical protein NQ318_015079 [Aromia moschata]|uniref:Fatty acyl-CoA reductase n=1 Tax=Aromia moschata TaxID=1265417 RepID=A0AAV8YZW5_9CUCU|nr:hypothetical protein NQ318_015079 [Aromia moschata]